MGKSTKLAIWIDHSTAYLLEVNPKQLQLKTIESNPITTSKLLAVQNQTLNSFYNKIINEIKSYKKIFLFGPATAKLELFDVLSEDQNMMKLKVEIIETPLLFPEQQDQYLKNYFG